MYHLYHLKYPFNLEKVAGGSSGGSSAALATNQVWLATGNDLGGSLRTPAGFNNIVGLRPMTIKGTYLLSISISGSQTQGIMVAI